MALTDPFGVSHLKAAPPLFGPVPAIGTTGTYDRFQGAGFDLSTGALSAIVEGGLLPLLRSFWLAFGMKRPPAKGG